MGGDARCFRTSSFISTFFWVAASSTNMKALRILACCLIAGVTASGGVVRGIVLEQASGRPMARTQMRLVPVPKGGNPGRPFALRTGLDGQYTFLSVPDGLYILDRKS